MKGEILTNGNKIRAMSNDEMSNRIKLLEELLCSSRYVDIEGDVSCLGEILDCPDKDCGQCVHGKITDAIEEILGRER